MCRSTAFYPKVGNHIVIPAGIMQLPIFSPDLPEYISYGGLGSTVRHELSHGIDAGSASINENGKTHRWWGITTVAHYESKAKCFAQQYSNMTFTDKKGKLLHVNGEATQEENTADAGGISASFTAWKKRDRVRANKSLPGLESFAQDQMSFLSYASIWCAQVKPEVLVMENSMDNHSPRDKRILGTLANSREFRNAFKCKAKEPTYNLW
jgi:endothelin-converting enzyme